MLHASPRLARLIGPCAGLFIGLIAIATQTVAANVQVTIPVFIDMTGQVSDELVGTQTTVVFTFFASTGSITVNSAGLSGPNAASYSFAKNTCVSGTVLTVTATCEIDVVFAPQQSGPLTEAIAMATSIGAQTFDISASGLLADLLVSPTQLDFGFQPVGTTSATRTVTFKNPNPVSVTVPVSANPPLGDFFPASGNCDIIPANGSCSFQYEWTPYSGGQDVGYWYAVVGYEYQDEYQVTQVTFTGQGVQDGATSVPFATYNVAAIGNDGAKVQNGGLDGAGNVYSFDFFTGGVSWSGQSFLIQGGIPNAVRESTLTLPAGQYYSVTLLGTGVNGNQVNQAFTVTYSDGTTSVVHQSLSDWKTPQHYVGESIALTTPYRLTVDGTTHTGPYYLYAYTLPLDHTKTAVSLTLPQNRNAAVLALNAGVAGVPVTAELAGLYNVTAVGVDGEAVVGNGIDQHSSAIALFQFDGVPLNELLLAIPAYNVPDAVANVTVPLPSGQYSTLHLDGMAVEGNKPNQSLTINYQDGTSTAITQSFSDWHTYQKYSHESIAVAMTYKLNPDGSKHPGTYNIYQYDIPIDATKLVKSVVLPKTLDVVMLSVALKP
jgi:hypothetical protein